MDETKLRAKLYTKDYKTLVRMLDKEMSVYVRNYRQIAPGYCKCVTCGKIMPWKQMQCGHYISRRVYATRFDLDNMRPQCAGCNGFRDGEHTKFRFALVEEIGEEKVKALEARALISGDRHIPREWLIEEIIKYRELNKKWEV